MSNIISSHKLKELFTNNSRKGQEIFPELIKRLIIASVNRNGNIRFPSGDAIWNTGFDGIVENITYENLFVPTGNSLWEIGTEKEYIIKINGDYDKRTKQVDLFDKKAFSFCLCTPFPWNGKGYNSLLNWEAQKNKLADWKKVKIIDGIMLSDWLNANIEVELWLLEQFNETEYLKISNFESKYKRMSEITFPKFNDEIMICSNKDKATQFCELITSMQNGIFILNSSINFEHALYFVLGALHNQNDNSISSRVLFVEDMKSLECVNRNSDGKIIILCFPTNEPINKYNNIYVCISIDIIQTPTLELNHIFMSDYRKALEAMGFEIMKCEEIANKTNRNISCLKRQYAIEPQIRKPDWASDNNKSEIIPIALLSEINCQNDGDKEIVEELSKKAFSEYIQQLDCWLGKNDSPIFKLGNIYKIYSKEEAIKVLGLTFDSPILLKLEETTKRIFNTQDNHYEKPVDQWYIRNTKFRYSINSIVGILSSFAILSSDLSSQDHYFSFLNNLIDIIKINKIKLHTYVKQFSLLSEISAKSIITYVSNSVDSDEPIFYNLITNEYESFTTCSNFLDVMWMLESCVQREDCAIDALRTILKIYYKNYKYSSKDQFDNDCIILFSPISSSYNIPIKPYEKFLIAKQQSSNLTDEQYKLAENLFTGMRWNAIDLWHSMPIPKWKQYYKGNGEYYPQEFGNVDKEATNWLCIYINDLPALLSKLINNKLPSYPIKIIQDLFISIKKKTTNSINIDNKSLQIIILQKLEWFNKVIKYEKHEESINTIINELLSLYNIIAPKDLFEEYEYIFESEKDQYILNLDSEDEDSDDYNYDKELQKRLERIKDIIGKLESQYGNSIRTKIINKTHDNNRTALKALYETSKDRINEINLLLDLKKINGITTYINSMPFSDEIKGLIINIKDEKILKSICMNLLISDEIIDYFDGKEIEELLWYRRYIWQDLSEKIINKLLLFSPGSLLHWMWLDKKNLTYENAIKVFQAIISLTGEKKEDQEAWIRQNHSHAFIEIIKKLDQRFETDELAIYEFQLLGLYMSNSYGDHRYPLGIKKYFWRYPEQFFYFINAYLENGKIKDLPRNSIIEKIIFDSKLSFGRHDCVVLIDYTIEKTMQLNDWIDKIMKLAKNESYKTVHFFEDVIVNLLALCPETADQTVWPPLNIADILEKFKYNWDIEYINEIKVILKNSRKTDLEPNISAEQMIAQHFSTSKTNSIGMRWVGDGSNEFQQAERYASFAEYYRITHPITALALEQISNHYRRDGERDRNSAIIGERL